MTETDYLSLATAINTRVDTFNIYLESAFHLEHICLEQPTTAHWIEDSSWGSIWPSKDSYGVYFLVGHRVDCSAEQGMYIGKASYGKRIGNRLHAHLLHGAKSKRYFKKAPDGSLFQIQMLFAIPMPNGRGAFGPALEEHLIHELKGELYLLNRVSNK